ncbi:MAG TPA: amino acid adenylation domain-containing protein, partial [Candidatus Deferrimicrobium sp.]|nr:amino acid adenylation domain-containing protein [Candidatus Deferrimicrobium sp.]
FKIDRAYNQRIPIGNPIANSIAYVVDKSVHWVPVGVSGELWVGGDGVSRGYLNNPELTRERFIDFHHSKLYRTGDLVRRLEDGTIEFIGRIDQQVKIRGFRIEVEEIEAALLKHDLVKEAVVIDRKEENGEKYLCGYIVVTENEDVELTGLKEFLARSLPDFMIPSYFIQVKSIPLNANGKLDREALPGPELKREKEYQPPENEIEKELAVLWAEVLSVGKDQIGRNDNFFDLGGHSLKAAVLTTQIHKVFDVKIPLSEIFLRPTLQELARYLTEAAKDKYADIKPVEKKEYYELSSAQARLYILWQMEPLSLVYNMPQTIVLDGVNKEKLAETFRRLIRRHESLRTSFIAVNEKPVQRIAGEVEFEIEIAEMIGQGQGEGDWVEKVIHDFVKPFDLSFAPLLRVGLVKVQEEKYVLLVDIHHIISDGVSQGILVKEFETIYNGGPLLELAPLRLQYKDYSEWQNSISYREILNRQEPFWLEHLAGELPVLNLPYDYTRPEVQSFAGNCKNFSLGRKETVSIKELAAGIGATLYMVLLGIFNLVLARLSGLEDIIVGSPVAGRNHADFQQIIGMFVNTLAMRNYPSGEKSVAGFLQEVKTAALQAFENRDYPFENLVESAAAVRDVGRNPIFDVVFALQNLAEQGNWLEPSAYSYESKIAKFDMTLSAAETGENLIFSLEYCTRLFKAETIERFISYFKNIIASIIKKPSQQIRDVEMLDEAEKQQLLVDFNNTGGKPFPNDKTIPQLFELQVARTPDHIAVSDNLPTGLHQSTYRELNEISTCLVYYLQQQGIKEHDLVGLLVNRSLEMIAGILGILKAGGGYVPLNPKAPNDRNEYMLSECGARFLLDFKHLHLNSLTKRPGGSTNFSPANFAYVIFTSGSTGKPKGVPVTHANLCPLLHWGYRNLGLGSKDRFLQNLSYYFDWSVWEIVIALTTGAGLYMVPDELLLNPEASVAFINRSDITVLHVTPTQYRYYLKAGEKPHPLKYLFIGAEKLSLELMQRSLASVNENCRVFNMYGPTECTIISAVLEIKRPDVEKFAYLGSVPIGKAVGNIDLFVLDKYLNVCPANVWGELYITGDGAARGYLNNPELTAAKFNRSYKSYRSYIFYKTGDLARRLPDGNVEFLGRIDQQVKIRGFRIE